MENNTFFKKYFSIKDNLNFNNFIKKIKENSILLVLDNNKLKTYNSVDKEEIIINLNERYNKRIKYKDNEGINRIQVKVELARCGFPRRYYFLLITNNNTINNLQIINTQNQRKSSCFHLLPLNVYIMNNTTINNIYYKNCEIYNDELKNTKVIEYEYTKEEKEKMIFKQKRNNLINEEHIKYLEECKKIEDEYLKKELDEIKKLKENTNNLLENKFKERELQEKINSERNKELIELENKFIEKLQKIKNMKQEN